jgi:hypothetical protein
MEQRTLREHDRCHQAQHHQREKFRGPELERRGGKRWAESCDQKCRNRASEK